MYDRTYKNASKKKAEREKLTDAQHKVCLLPAVLVPERNEIQNSETSSHGLGICMNFTLLYHERSADQLQLKESF